MGLTSSATLFLPGLTMMTTSMTTTSMTMMSMTMTMTLLSMTTTLQLNQNLSILSYLSDLGLGALLVLVGHNGVDGDALDDGGVVQVNGFGLLGFRRKKSSKASKLQADQFSSFLTADCYEKNAIWWRHLASKKLAPILNVPMNWRQKLMNYNTVSDGYFGALCAKIGPVLRKILDLEGAGPKTKGHIVE